MSCKILFENPDAIFPIMSIIKAVVNVAFLPKISLILPYSGKQLVEVRKKAEGTHDAIAPAWKSELIVGREVATMT